jgi:excisionase family DNA binding protein
MNLADAIRMASHGQSPMKAVTPADWAAAQAANEEMVHARDAEIAAATQPTEGVSLSLGTEHPHAAHPSVSSGNVVRLELFLTPEQMTGLFKAIMAGQHSVMTLREAAAYLRMPAASVQRLAEEGELPGLLIDHKWRFPKANLDDWLSLKAAGLEEDDAA